MKFKKVTKQYLKGKTLPYLKILSVKNVDMVEMTMDVDDSVLNELVEYGKRVATKEDYFRIAFHKALVDSLDEFSKEKTKTRRQK
ncbi:MAG: hypothetical protein EBZ44_05930 [Verrucomicrobia bacterium]|nr:hypothetical protein [bacterium]NDD57239.1 hypothetical protein [Verrucomicrobiota bacterium]